MPPSPAITSRSAHPSPQYPISWPLPDLLSTQEAKATPNRQRRVGCLTELSQCIAPLAGKRCLCRAALVLVLLSEPRLITCLCLIWLNRSKPFFNSSTLLGTACQGGMNIGDFTVEAYVFGGRQGFPFVLSPVPGRQLKIRFFHPHQLKIRFFPVVCCGAIILCVPNLSVISTSCHGLCSVSTI